MVFIPCLQQTIILNQDVEKTFAINKIKFQFYIAIKASHLDSSDLETVWCYILFSADQG